MVGELRLRGGEDGVAESPEGVFGSDLSSFSHGSASPLNPQCVYVRYTDHVFFRNVQAPVAEAVVREVVGWVKEETEEVLLIECDRPLLQGCRGFNGVAILKNCIVSMGKVDLQGVQGRTLSSQEPKKKDEYALLTKGSEKLSPKNPREGQK